MYRKLLSAVFLLAAIAGCVPQQVKPTITRIPFPLQEYKQLKSEGTSTLKGQAFLRTRGGDVKVAAGSEVLLNPVTSYSDQWYEESYLKLNPMTPVDQQLWQYVKKKIADASGRFTFTNVPAGSYYVTTIVTWEAATGYRGALEPQGGAVTKKITISEGQEVEVILTK